MLFVSIIPLRMYEEMLLKCTLDLAVIIFCRFYSRCQIRNQ